MRLYPEKDHESTEREVSALLPEQSQPELVTSELGNSNAPEKRSQQCTISRQCHSWRNAKLGSTPYKNFGKQEIFSKKKIHNLEKSAWTFLLPVLGGGGSSSQPSADDWCHPCSAPAAQAESTLHSPRACPLLRGGKKGPLKAPELQPDPC